MVREMISLAAEEVDPPLPSGYCPSKVLQKHTSSSSISLSIQTEHSERTWVLEQGEQICRDFEQGDCIFVNTPAIKLQCSWPTDCTGGAIKPAIRAHSYRVRVEYMERESETVPGTQIVDVDRMQCDSSEVVCLDPALGIGRVICRIGQHRVRLTLQQIARNGMS